MLSEEVVITVLVALAIGFALGRSRRAAFENQGEAAVWRALTKNFTGTSDHLLNTITLPFDGGTTQIDHVLVSRSGIHSLVVFTGNARFKTERPTGVFDVQGLVQHIRQFTGNVLSENRLQFCVGRLECYRKLISRQTDVEHQAYLNKKFGNAT